jgi:DNA repair photolyase
MQKRRAVRGTEVNPPNRFEVLRLVPDEECPPEERRGRDTLLLRDDSRSLITFNSSPDVPFDASLNPYRGCEHGCIYCYARPTHEYLGFSAGLDFETKLLVKERAPELLRKELSRRSWQPRMLALSGVTDPYQPIERRLELTRRCLQVLAECRNPVGVITKNALVSRDIDVLRDLAAHGAANVSVSITTLDEQLRRVMEPRTATIEMRLETIARLNEAGVPAGVMVAPVIPGLTDHELPRILARAGQAGARFAGYVLLRLPHAVAGLFEDWLARALPERRQKVLQRIVELRDGRLNDPRFGTRMRGSGVWADLFASVFRTSRARAGIPDRWPPLSISAFRRPDSQRSLFPD